MARWRLTDTHYIHGRYSGEDRTAWQFEETNRDTGRTARKLFTVPAYLEKETIVCQNEKHPRDFEFVGPPTPEMEPLDDEAEAISAAEQPKWIHPIDSLPGQGGGFNEALLSQLVQQLEAVARQQPVVPSPAIAAGSVSRAEFELLQAQLAEMQAQLLKSGPQRDEEEPLPEVEPTAIELAKSEAAVDRRA